MSGRWSRFVAWLMGARKVEVTEKEVPREEDKASKSTRIAFEEVFDLMRRPLEESDDSIQETEVDGPDSEEAEPRRTQRADH